MEFSHFETNHLTFRRSTILLDSQHLIYVFPATSMGGSQDLDEEFYSMYGKFKITNFLVWARHTTGPPSDFLYWFADLHHHLCPFWYVHPAHPIHMFTLSQV